MLNLFWTLLNKYYFTTYLLYDLPIYLHESHAPVHWKIYHCFGNAVQTDLPLHAGPDKTRPREPTPAKQQTEDALVAAMLDLSQLSIPTNTILREELRKKGFNATVVRNLLS